MESLYPCDDLSIPKNWKPNNYRLFLDIHEHYEIQFGFNHKVLILDVDIFDIDKPCQISFI